MHRINDDIQVGRWKLPASLASTLSDFCEAHRGAPEHRVIADAVRAFIADRLEAEPELKKRFDQARRERLGIVDRTNITVLPAIKNGK